MFRKNFIAVIVFALFSLITAVSDTIAQPATTFAAGLKSPTKIIYAKTQGYFLVSEAGLPNVPNSGRISIVTNDGVVSTLLDGLPSGQAPPENGPSGPTGMWVQDDKLYIAIGAGNSTLNGPAPGSEIPNPNPNSPLFSSVLEYKFAPSLLFFFFNNMENNVLTPADHTRLATGQTIFLSRFGPIGASLRMVANFPNFTAAPRQDVPNNVRPSNPFGLVSSAGTLYVTDAAQNSIRTINLGNGSIGTLITYPARQNPNQGPPFIDPVPDSLRLFGKKLLVTFLTGFPFPAGSADVRQYDLGSGAESQVIGGLSTAIDVLPVNQGDFCTTIYTLEFSTNMLAGAPGRLQRFSSPTAQPVTINDELISPTSIARAPSSGDLLITEIFPGRIIRINMNSTN